LGVIRTRGSGGIIHRNSQTRVLVVIGHLSKRGVQREGEKSIGKRANGWGEEGRTAHKIHTRRGENLSELETTLLGGCLLLTDTKREKKCNRIKDLTVLERAAPRRRPLGFSNREKKN